MTLSKLERLQLSNQFRILEALIPEQANHYARARCIVEKGYELHYDEIGRHIDEAGLTHDECNEVVEILSMFYHLNFACRELTDKSGINGGFESFGGFDGNCEARQMAYAKFVCEEDLEKRFEILKITDFDSHEPMLERYRRMLQEYKRMAHRLKMTKEDAIRITNAAIHPMNR